MTERLIAHGDYHHTPDQPCYECGTMPEPASSVPGAPDETIPAIMALLCIARDPFKLHGYAVRTQSGEKYFATLIDAVTFAIADRINTELAAKERTIEQLRAELAQLRNALAGIQSHVDLEVSKLKGEPKWPTYKG